MVFLSWHVYGIQARAKRGMVQMVHAVHPDLVCLQGTRTSQLRANVTLGCETEIWNPEGDCRITNGTAVFSHRVPRCVQRGMGEEDPDREGRLITLEFDGFTLMNFYAPDASGYPYAEHENLRLTWYRALERKIRALGSRPLILAGMAGIALKKRDVGLRKRQSPVRVGFRPEERSALQALLDLGLTDCYRALHPEEDGAYTFWASEACRKQGLGCRFDYFLVSDCLRERIVRAEILPDTLGAHHAPILLELDL